MIHLHPTTELAPRVLLPGDPGRALALAQHLLEKPLMFNHNRGLWGYTGTAADGELLTIQSTGMGGPSAAIVVEELCDLGVTRAIRVGTCGALVPRLGHGDLIVAKGSRSCDGASRALGAADEVIADPGVVSSLLAAAGAGTPVGIVATTDLFYDPDPARAQRWAAQGVLAVEMEAAAVLQVAHRRGIAAGVVLAVSDTFDDDGARSRIDEDGMLRAAKRLGDVAAAALGVAAT
jgi:DeoD family purine-nucleoside phosphorylase